MSKTGIKIKKSAGLKRGYSRGVLLLEYLIAVVLMAMTAVVVATLMLTFSVQTKDTKFRSEANLVAGSLRAELANYVAENRDQAEAPPGDPAYPWHLPGDWGGVCTPIDHCTGGCDKTSWALAACVHDVTRWLPEAFYMEHGATASYTVTAKKAGVDIAENQIQKGDEVSRTIVITINEAPH